ncbi:MAG: phosphatidate cytidylyltransferase [Erysipelotrichaceae bacterium]|jgi:phosphatidate cytidylyltransferase|nr:phosphatidate cytidylyltransferase [Erysipelotrichaceae bacterium]
MKQRIITALAIIATVFPLIYFFPFWGLRAVILVFSALAVYEITAIIDKRIPLLGIIGVYLMVLVLSFCWEQNYVVFLGLFIVLLFTIDVLYSFIDITRIAYLFLMTLMFSTAIRGLIQANVMFGFTGVMFVFVVTYLCDSAAYFIGRRFGKHKLIPKVSPNKTVEGAIGGFLVSFIAGVVYLYIWSQFNNGMAVFIAACITMPLTGQIGDLAFSSIKRHFNQKDFGSIFPGHGGALDRIDSLLFNFMVFHVILMFYNYLVTR